MVLNILQRRQAHLHTHFQVQKSKFDLVAQSLISVTSDDLLSAARHLEKEGKYNELNSCQQKALGLLQHVNTIAAHVPGSQASKIYIRNEI